uniref:Intimal thickness related receptor IRP domain-containing protein n=1 Tax=Cuerna arida TaxID=1464854 RepID=A0A1B6F959_9HEMI
MIDSMISMVIAILLYLSLQVYTYQSAVKDGTVRYRTKHLMSTLFFMYGGLLFIYRIECQLWKTNSLLSRFLYKVIATVVALEVLINCLWRSIEYFILVLLQTAVNSLFQKIGICSHVGEWPFTSLLYVISLSIYSFANNGDRYYDYYFNDEDSDNETYPTSLTDSTSLSEYTGYGDTNFQNTEIRLQPPTPARVSYRGKYTVTARHEAPLRRSTRHRNSTLT